MSVLLGIQKPIPLAHRPMSVGVGETVHRTANLLVSLMLDEGLAPCPLHDDVYPDP